MGAASRAKTNERASGHVERREWRTVTGPAAAGRARRIRRKDGGLRRLAPRQWALQECRSPRVVVRRLVQASGLADAA
jgi:hypothetical protein